jgi:hypothetical protein
MKKLVILALAISMLLPFAANADTVYKDGDPAFFTGGFPNDVIFPGQTKCYYPAPTNFGFVNGTCSAEDTFCVHVENDSSWAMTAVLDYNDPENSEYIFGDAFTLGAGNYYPRFELCVTAPCEALLGDNPQLRMWMAYTDINVVCQPDSGDCPEQTEYGGNPYYNYWDFYIEVVEAPPALYIAQDSLYFVARGQTAAYVPFGICNGDPCAPDTDYGFNVVSNGTVGSAINQSGTTLGVPGGECGDVYGVVNAGTATTGDQDILTIVAWDASGTVYDTCVQIIEVIDPVPVPLFTAPVVTILVLAMILAAAVIMKRYAVGKA